MAQTQVVGIEGLADAVEQALQEYSQEVAEGVKQECKTVADECAKEIKQNALQKFGGTGAYAKSWRVQTAYESKSDIRLIVHSKKHYRLAHLLENGHAKVNGGRVEGRPHIEPAAKNAEEKLLKKVKVVIRGT